MGDFEWALVNSLNSFFEKDGIAAIAYRLKQSRFSGQLMDILVDSKIPEYYLAIECKSLDARKTNRSTSSSTSASPPERTRWRARRSSSPAREGRASWRWSCATAPAKRRSAHLVPWGQIFQSYNAGKTGLSLRDIEINPPLERKGGAYRISRLDIVRISGYFDLAGEGDGQEEDPASEE